MQRVARPISSGSRLWSRERIDLLHDTDLMGKPRSARLDEVCALATRLLDVPASYIAVISDTRQYFLASSGLSEERTISHPLGEDRSICKHVVDIGETLAITDAQQDEILCRIIPVKEWLRAYLGIPLVAPDGQIIGSFCVVDLVPRAWSEQDVLVIEHMSTLAAAVLLTAPSA